jgi:hypothetical protein
VDLIISISDLKKLQKKRTSQTFELVPFVDQSQTVNKVYLDTIKKKICSKHAFYEGLSRKMERYAQPFI